jgi:tetratricopeptide (TPR) repeat protein
MPLETIDQKHLRAAEGFVSLGMYLDADSELDNIDPLCRATPEVLAVRLEIYSGLKKWELMQVVAEKLANYDPANVQWAIALAYATRRADSIQKAREILSNALRSHPDEPTIRYNLACYECQLGNLAIATEHLTQATKANAKFKLMALDDPDLEPLWTEIGRVEN